MVDTFSPDELRALERAAQAARSRAAQRAQRYVDGSPQRPRKEEVSSEEYVKRLRHSMQRDSVTASDVQQHRIEASLASWKKQVGHTFAEATTENPRILERVARIGDEAGRHKTSLLLQGDLGVGKTWSAYAYVHHAILGGHVTSGQVIADTESGVLSKIASSGYKRSDLMGELLNPRYQIYFIDDVGQGYFGREDSRTELWYELIDHVYSHQLALVITTNLAYAQNSGLGRWLGRRSFDRLKTLLGNDGVLEPSKVNKRESVLEERDRRLAAPPRPAPPRGSVL